ncbi:8011_t:CDS:2 [Funneliformis geosporum]|uniref:8603_t:CDS:1 n=1 Tax=Funneliformis geosporum TaxID=1117311 RepID=A0A9W4SW36_9GLOM|nr:8011_t:CDS:2 [Funneliformis geosporum]CAI2183515.1 8603_t:CDS:2 [Funneliformis geosporum]
MKSGKRAIEIKQMKKIIVHKTQVFFIYSLYEDLVVVKDICSTPLKGEIPSASIRSEPSPGEVQFAHRSKGISKRKRPRKAPEAQKNGHKG